VSPEAGGPNTVDTDGPVYKLVDVDGVLVGDPVDKNKHEQDERTEHRPDLVYPPPGVCEIDEDREVTGEGAGKPVSGCFCLVFAIVDTDGPVLVDPPDVCGVVEDRDVVSAGEVTGKGARRPVSG
jgi:hypothetical protein